MLTAVVDYGMGNLHSVRHALEAAGAHVEVTSRPDTLEAADRIVLPGVGAFAECVENLRASGMVEALEEQVLKNGKPLLGICLGLQVLAREGHEMQVHQGLNWLPASVRKLDPGRGLKVPHVGWNDVTPCGAHPLFHGFRPAPTFYFLHSYALVPDDPALVAATTDYGGRVTAAIARDNIFATQFHPEKSQENGQRLLRNFLAWKP